MKNKIFSLSLGFIVFGCAVVNSAFAGTFKSIAIDGSFTDWTDVPLAGSQAQTTNVVAYKEVYLANDDDYLYIRFNLFSSANPFTSKQNIFVDTDTSAVTGYSAHGIGSDFLVQAGNGYRETSGTFNAGAANNVDWLASPTGAGTDFEMRISRGATYADGSPIFTNNTIALILESSETSGNEWCPPASGGVTYTFATAPVNTNTPPAGDFITNSYSSSTEDFANPERGFYIQADSYASSPSAISSSLASYRINGRSSPGNVYTAKISLLLRLFYLDSFVSAPISSNFLNSIQTDFDAIRAQGVKAIVRFAYNQDQTRPFNEPSKAQILAHIEQLKPLLKKNSDVIAVLQQGFIAAWGEGYFTDVFYTNGQATAQHWLARNELLAALLGALPPERMVQVRTPQMKQKFVYGPTVHSSATPLDPTLAFKGSDAARIGFHNDCYLASSTDSGTFSSNDAGGGTTQQDIANFRNYVAQDSRFAPVGGETCALNPPTDDCGSVGGNADPDMARSHYSFLNESYNVSVNNKWEQHGCMDDIIRRLGYRLSLVSSVLRTAAQPGQTIPVSLTFLNSGFAAPYNPRGLELIFRNPTTGKRFFAELSRDTDARRWLPGTNYAVNAQLSLPTNIPAGNYEMFLNLPDPAPSLYGMVPYAIHLANSNIVSSAGAVLGTVWDAVTGYHRLGGVLTINATATNAPANGKTIPVLGYSAVAENYAVWKTRNFPSTPDLGEPANDPDIDSRINLIEYAVGSDPNSRNDDNYISTSFENDVLLLSVPKGPGVKDVSYEVESSSTLNPANWSTSAVNILEDDALALRASYAGLATSGFLRLKVALK